MGYVWALSKNILLNSLWKHSVVSYADAHDADNASSVTTPFVGQFYNAASNYWDVWRIGLVFDLSGRPDYALSATKLRFYWENPHSNSYVFYIEAVDSEGLHDPLDVADFGYLRDRVDSYGALEIPPSVYNQQDYAEIDLALPSVGDTTIIALRCSQDIDNQEPAFLDPKYIGIYSSSLDYLVKVTGADAFVASAKVKFIVDPLNYGISYAPPSLKFENSASINWSNVNVRVKYIPYPYNGEWLYSDWKNNVEWEKELSITLSNLDCSTQYLAKIEIVSGDFSGTSNGIYFTTKATGAILELAFDQSILATGPNWTDVTSYMRSLHPKRGRLHEFDKCEAGTAIFVLNNVNGEWWRYNTKSPFYGTSGNVHPLTLVRLSYYYNRVKKALYYGIAESFKPKWLAKYGFNCMMELKCVDVFKSFTRYRILDANVVLSHDVEIGQDFVTLGDVTNYVVGQTVKLHDDNSIRLGTSENLIIIDILPGYSVWGDGASTIRFSTQIVGEYRVTNEHAALKKWPQVLSGIRFHDVLLEAMWPLALASIDDGQVELIEITPAAGGDKVVDTLYAIAEAEDGNVFVASDGKVTFHDSIRRTKYPYNTPQATFGDDGVDLGYFDVELSDDDEYIFNECDITGDAIGAQVMLDSELQPIQGPRAIDLKSSLIANEHDAIGQAFTKVERFKIGKPRVSLLTIRPDGDPDNLYPVIINNDLGARLTFKVNSARNPALINQAYHVEGIIHDWDQSTNLWETQLQLWEVNKYRVFKAQHDGWVGKISEVDYLDCHDALEADIKFNDGLDSNGNPDAYGLDVRVGQWVTYAGSFFVDARVYRGLLEFNTTSVLLTENIIKAFILIYIKYARADREWSIRLTNPMGDEIPLDYPDYFTPSSGIEDCGSGACPAVGGNWLAIELTDLGLYYIEKEGITRFGVRSSRDCDTDDPKVTSAEWCVLGSNVTTRSPKLILQTE